jgi:hypothetical protein
MRMRLKWVLLNVWASTEPEKAMNIWKKEREIEAITIVNAIK